MRGFASYSSKKTLGAAGAWLFALIGLALVQPLLPAGIARTVVADVFFLLFLALPLAVLALWTWQWLQEIDYNEKDGAYILAFIVVMYIAAYVFIHVFFRAEHDIKIYDSTVYWIKVIEDGARAAESIPEYLAFLRHTFTFEYNNLAVLPLLPLSHVLGTSFAGYCTTVAFAYYLPACFFLTLFCLRLFLLARETRPGIPAFIAIFLLCALCVGFLWPVMDGYLDVVGVLIIAVLLNASLYWDAGTFSWRSVITLSVLSVLLVLSRRWYAFYIVGFYLGFGVSALITNAGNREALYSRLKKIVLNMLAIAAVSTLCIVIIQPALLQLFISTHYATAYSFYKTMSVWGNLWIFSKNLGMLWLAAAYGGISILVASSPTRLICLRLLIAMIVAIVLFCTVQDLGYHHHYLIYPTILIFAGVMYARIAAWAQEKTAALLLLIGVVVLTVVNFLFGYCSELTHVAVKTEPFTTAMRRYPMVNANYDVIREVVRNLTEKIGETSQHVYVVGDGLALSPEILKRSLLPEKTDAAPYVLVNSIVDLRDGFPSQLFMAEYVVLSDPFITEFPKPQQVSYQVYDLLLRDPAGSDYYQREASYTAADGDIVVLKKIRPIGRAFVDNLRDRMQNYYPQTPFVYSPNYFIALNEIPPAIEYQYNFWDDNSFTFHKKAAEEITIQFHGIEGLSTISFAISCWNEGLELRAENRDKVLARQPLIQAVRAPYRFDIGGSDALTITIANANPDVPVDGNLILYHPEME